jgi:hypothetical protein
MLGFKSQIKSFAIKTSFEGNNLKNVLSNVVIEQMTRQLEKALIVLWPGVTYKSHVTEQE